MQSFIDRYIEQGINQGQRLGEATALLRQMERKFGAPSDSVRERVLAADSDTLLEWLDRILNAESVDAVLKTRSQRNGWLRRPVGLGNWMQG